MSDNRGITSQIARAFLEAFGLLGRALAPSNIRAMSEEETRQVQAEFELLERRDRALRRKYASAITKLPELARRAEAHGVAFSFSAEPYKRAAILDFLDNPNAPTGYPSPKLPQEQQAPMWEYLAGLRGLLMRRDDPGWDEEAWLSAQPAFAPDGQAARARAQHRAASAAGRPPRPERR